MSKTTLISERSAFRSPTRRAVARIGPAILTAASLLACCSPVLTQNANPQQPNRPAKPQPPRVAKRLKPVAGTPASAARSAEIPVAVTVRPNCEVAGPVFTLAEIADFQGDNKALIAQLGAIEIGASPLPGLSRIINPGDVTVRLRQHHMESSRVDVALPPGVRITRLGHDIAADEITLAAIESAKDAIKNQPDATLEVLSGAGRLMVPAGKSRVLAGAWRGNPEIGTVTVPVSVLVDGKAIQSVDIVLRIHRKTIVLVALRDIQLHEIIGPNDVGLSPVDLTSGVGAPLTGIEESLGKRATRRIMANSPITAMMLEKAPLISANDVITIEFVYGGLRVTAAGLARQTGAEGDTIHVCAIDTKKELDGVVIDKHTVRVDDFGYR